MRCRKAIKGFIIVSRCRLEEGHEDLHEAKGLEQFPDQKIRWSPGHAWEFETDRDDEYSWEE